MTYDNSGWRQRLHTVIFEADTRAGRAFDVALIVCILASVAVVILESIASISDRCHAGCCGPAAATRPLLKRRLSSGTLGVLS